MDLVFGSVSKAGTLDLQFPYITFCGKSTHSVGSAFKKNHWFQSLLLEVAKWGCSWWSRKSDEGYSMVALRRLQQSGIFAGSATCGFIFLQQCSSKTSLGKYWNGNFVYSNVCHWSQFQHGISQLIKALKATLAPDTPCMLQSNSVTCGQGKGTKT